MKKLSQISVGELVDKISILQIKSAKITDPAKLVEVNKELDLLVHLTRDLNGVGHWLEKIKAVNLKLWEVEDELRVHEKAKNFDSFFIALARSVYYLNDDRFKVKDEINKFYGSEINEQKSYEKYN